MWQDTPLSLPSVSPYLPLSVQSGKIHKHFIIFNTVDWPKIEAWHSNKKPQQTSVITKNDFIMNDYNVTLSLTNNNYYNSYLGKYFFFCLDEIFLTFKLQIHNMYML